MSSRWKSEWNSVCPIFRLNRWVLSAAQTFLCPLISLLTRLTHFPCRAILPGLKLRVVGEGELLLFNNEFVLFCITNQAQLTIHLSNSCFERVLEIFWPRTRFLYQLCAGNEPFVSFTFLLMIPTFYMQIKILNR